MGKQSRRPNRANRPPKSERVVNRAWEPPMTVFEAVVTKAWYDYAEANRRPQTGIRRAWFEKGGVADGIEIVLFAYDFPTDKRTRDLWLQFVEEARAGIDFQVRGETDSYRAYPLQMLFKDGPVTGWRVQTADGDWVLKSDLAPFRVRSVA